MHRSPGTTAVIESKPMTISTLDTATGRKTYPVITADEIQVGDVVRINGQMDRFEILKAKPIIKNRVQIKCRSRFWSGSTVRKFNLKTSHTVELIERGGIDTAAD